MERCQGEYEKFWSVPRGCIGSQQVEKENLSGRFT